MSFFFSRSLCNTPTIFLKKKKLKNVNYFIYVCGQGNIAQMNKQIENNQLSYKRSFFSLESHWIQIFLDAFRKAGPIHGVNDKVI